MFYTIYKITNQIDGKVYIGSHKTKDLDDNYMGSGKYLKRAQEKYGLDNFKKEILFVFDTPELMYAKEAEIVNEEFLATVNTYNLKIGGFGGWDFINETVSKETKRNAGSKGGLKTKESNLKYIPTPTANDRSIGGKKSMEIHGDRIRRLARSDFSLEKKKQTYKIRSHQQAEKNSQFGTMWITNGELNSKIKKNEVIPDGWSKGRKLKK